MKTAPRPFVALRWRRSITVPVDPTRENESPDAGVTRAACGLTPRNLTSFLPNRPGAYWTCGPNTWTVSAYVPGAMRITPPAVTALYAAAIVPNGAAAVPLPPTAPERT